MVEASLKLFYDVKSKIKTGYMEIFHFIKDLFIKDLLIL